MRKRTILSNHDDEQEDNVDNQDDEQEDIDNVQIDKLDDKTHFDDDGENTSYIAFIMLVQYFLVFNLYKYILYNVYH